MPAEPKIVKGHYSSKGESQNLDRKNIKTVEEVMRRVEGNGEEKSVLGEQKLPIRIEHCHCYQLLQHSAEAWLGRNRLLPKIFSHPGY